MLVIDRAFGEAPFVTRVMFDATPARYLSEVDYAIEAPPMRPRMNSSPAD